MANAKQPVFGPNGVVLNADDYEPWRKRSGPKVILNPLRKREPRLVRIWMGFILAGPLNPSLLFWVPLALIADDLQIELVYIFVVFPCALAAAFGSTYLYGQDQNCASIFGVALKVMAWTGLILASPVLLTLLGGPLIFFGTLFVVVPFVLVIGVPAALAGALVMRFVVFEASRAD